MKAALILLAMLAVTGLILYLLDKWNKTDESPTEDNTQHSEADAQATGCTDASCALHDNCPSEQLLRGACSDKVEYFDDQELDAFSGRDPESYTDDELEQFRDVLYTLKPHEIMAWYQSLNRRGIKLGSDLYRELLSLAAE